VLLYCLEVCPVKMSDLHSLDFFINRFFHGVLYVRPILLILLKFAKSTLISRCLVLWLRNRKRLLSRLDTLDCIFNLQLRFSKLRILPFLPSTICGEKKKDFQCGSKMWYGSSSCLGIFTWMRTVACYWFTRMLLYETETLFRWQALSNSLCTVISYIHLW